MWTAWKICVTSERTAEEKTNAHAHDEDDDNINNEGMLMIYIETCYSNWI